MIIVDLQQVMISNFMAGIGNHTNIEIDVSLLRHMILNSIRGYNAKFRNEYGEMVIACDGYKTWRRDAFPYYKASRKKSREESELDWGKIFDALNIIREELKQFFPYRVIHLEGAEADDVIGALVHKYGPTGEKIMIVSGDKDFKQLHTYMGVKQYDPVKSKVFVEPRPDLFLKEQIMRGDKSDGIPNFLSGGNSFVMNIRQKSLMQKKLDIWLHQEPEEFCEGETLRRYRENEALIDLSKIPTDLQEKIFKMYEEEGGKSRTHLFNYFIRNKLKLLLSDIDQF